MATKRTNGDGGVGQPPAGDVALVVIVDDDSSVRRSAGRLIRSFGYRAETFASGREFLDAIPDEPICCLVLDVRMPEMDGLEVQRRLTERGLRIPIVFLTGRASDEEEHRARSAKAIEFLRKPVDTARLRQVLERLGRQP